MTNSSDIMGLGWKNVLKESLNKPPFLKLQDFLGKERLTQKKIYPAPSDIFKAFQYTDFNDVKVVILGQDPYHGAGQAHGLSFSVQEGVKIPPSLKNIYKELERDFGNAAPKSGDLTHWAQQGVLLLNATLTVEDGKAGSHQNLGWEEFTDEAIQILNDKKNHIVFMLWGAYAQKKGRFINQQKHLVLKAVHPSPLSAHRGFIGCGHFSQANSYLIQNQKTAIKWL